MLSRLSRADRICGISALLTVIAVFMHWYKFNTATQQIALNGFRSGLLGIIVFFAAATIILMLLVREGFLRIPQLSMSFDARLFLGVGALSTASVLLQMIIGSSGSHAMDIGIVLALFTTAGMGLGGYFACQEAGILQVEGRQVEGRRHSSRFQ